MRRCYENLHRPLAAGEIEPRISELIGFDDLPDALRRLAGRETTGIVFDPSN